MNKFYYRVKYIFILGLTNLDLEFRVKGWSSRDRVLILKIQINIKNFKIKMTILVILFLEKYFCDKNLK